MKSLRTIVYAALALGAALFLTGCGKGDSHASHDGHDHGEHAEKGHTATKDGVVMCTEHNVPEDKCAVCKPEEANKLQPGQSMQVRLPAENSAALVGIETTKAEQGRMADSVDCVAELSFNQNALAQVSAPAAGIVESVSVDLGSRVEEGQTLARLWSAAISEAVAKAVLARQTVLRERALRGEGVTSEQSLQEAEANYRAAYQAARTYGFTDEALETLAKQPKAPVYVEVKAPFAGEIIDRSAVRGALVDTGKPLFSVVDHSTVWAMLQVPEQSLGRVKIGQTVELRIDSLPEKVFLGRVTWVAPAIDEHTRMARVRAEFGNPDCELKDKMFASARILTRKTETATLVPEAAVQHIEGRTYVFVKREADLFDARFVSLGARFGGKQEILAGLGVDEQVAVKHAFAVKSAMLMSHLGAGCADD